MGFTGGVIYQNKELLVGETNVFKRIGRVVDTAGLKGFTGDIFTKIKNFFVGETSIFKRIGTVVDSADTVKSFTGGTFTKIPTQH